ncbi:MAG: hypothetical protein WC069_04640 [Candidatus Shapirobacteria bacterium]
MLLFSLLTLIAPFPLLVVEKFFPYPYLFEELFKFFVVKNLSPKNNYYNPLILGIIFSLSESALYLVNFFAIGNFSNLPVRLISTTLLHSFTFLLLYTFRDKKYLSLLSLIAVVAIHYFYNYFIFIFTSTQ